MAVYVFCFMIFVGVFYLYIRWVRTLGVEQATNTTEDIPGEFQYKEAEIDENNKQLLGVQDVTTAFMMASEMGKKFHSNQTIVTVLDETEEETEEESEVSEGPRPASGILQETLTEIANQEQEAVEEPNQESEDGEEEDEDEDEESNE